MDRMRWFVPVVFATSATVATCVTIVRKSRSKHTPKFKEEALTEGLKVVALVDSRIAEDPVETRENVLHAHQVQEMHCRVNEARFWEEAIDKFEKGEICHIQDHLLWASSSLSQEEQLIFIEAATYFHDEPLEQALAVWETAYDDSHKKWKKLLSMSMVKELPDDSWSIPYLRVWVHELLRDVAKALSKSHVASANKFENWLRADTCLLQLPSGDRKFFSDSDGSQMILPTDSLDNREGLKSVDLDDVDFIDSDENQMILPTDLLDNGEALKHVDLDGVDFADSDGSQMILPTDSLDNGEALKQVDLDGVDFTDSHGSQTILPTDLLDNGEALKHVDLDGVDFTDSDGSQIILPTDLLDNCEALKYVDLDGVVPEGLLENIGRHLRILKWKMRSMTQLPPLTLQKMDKLYVLELANWKVPIEFSEALGKLSNLRILSLGHLVGLSYISSNFGELIYLRRLELVGLSLSCLPDSFGNLRSLQYLSLVELWILKLPESFGELLSLTHLSFVNVDIHTLPNSFGALASLSHLSFVNVTIDALPDSFGALSSLSHLFFVNVTIDALPDSFGELPSLSHLSFSNTKIRELPDSFGSLTCLVSLRIQNCENLENLPASFGQLKALQQLSLVDVNIRALPDSFGDLCSLATLTIRDCENLVDLSDGFGRLFALQHLSLVNVNIRTLPETIMRLSSLRTMTIRDCGKLEAVPWSFGYLDRLEGFVLRGCRQLKRLPNYFGRLMTLTIEKDDQLEALSGSFGKLGSLRHLTLVNVTTSTLPDSIGYLSSLVTFTIKSCENLKSLNLSFVRFGDRGTSRELVLHGCRRLKKLPDNFDPLMKLTIDGDDQLEALSSALSNCLRELTTLRRLTLVNVSSVELPESLLFSLVMLTIRSCPTLSCLPSSFARLSSLKELYIQNCPLLSTLCLPSSFGRFSLLKELEIQNCPLLSTLQGLERHDSFAEEVGDSIQDPWGWLSSLENLTLSGCRITSARLFAMLDAIMRVNNPVTGLVLQRLDLHDNFLGDEALHLLITWADLNHLQQLKDLNLSMNKEITSSGLLSLMEAIQNGHLSGLQRVNWVGNLYSDATAEAITQAYYEDMALTTGFDVDWAGVSDISLRTKAQEYRNRNRRLKELTEKLMTGYEAEEELVLLSHAEGSRKNCRTEDNVQVSVSKEKLKTEDKTKEELHEDLPLSSAKVFLCGYPEVGKTTLRKTLFDPLRSRNLLGWWNSEPRTRGIELSRVEEVKENEDSFTLILWDLAGQEEFHILHGSFFPDLGFAGGIATTFALVFNATWRKEVKEELKYWLGFVASSSSTLAKRHVVIVLNQFPDKQRSDDHLQMWRNLVSQFADIFDDLLQIYAHPIIIDARDAQSVQPLKDHLFNHARKLLKNVVVPGVCIKLQKVLKEWAQGEKFLPILSWQTFEGILHSMQEAMHWSGELLKNSALYLHEIGEIIYFDNNGQTGAGSEHIGVVVPEPQWFCRHIVGELLLPERMLEPQGERPIKVTGYGSISMMEFKSFFMHELAPGTRVDDVISMLEQMGLGYRKGVDEIIIPSLISEDDTSKKWENEGSLWVMGRCLTTEDKERLSIPSILFRKLQAELVQCENWGDRGDSEYIAGKSFSNFTEGEHLILIEFGVNPSDRACGRIDVLVKTFQESENPAVRWAQIECISRIMEKVEKLCVSYCPGVKYDIKVIEPWYARDKTPRMIDRNLMSLRKIKDLLSKRGRYSGWKLNKKPMELKWFLSNRELEEVEVLETKNRVGHLNEHPYESARINFHAVIPNPDPEVNDSLYELTPPLDTPKMEILFFHGIREEGDSEGAHISTWESGDGSCIWPQTWLFESFPRARIFFVYYDSVVKGRSGRGRSDSDGSDTYLITENLASDLVHGRVGQTLNCPLILVGHCLGGMVIKELLLRANSESSLTMPDAPKLKRLIENVRGIFYYDTPHRGTFLDQVAGLDVASNNLLSYFQALGKHASRRNYDFARLCKKFSKWRIGGLGATLPTHSVLFDDDVVVPEASSREGECDFFYMIDEDHYSICKPTSKKTKSFSSLETLIQTILDDMKAVDTVQ